MISSFGAILAWKSDDDDDAAADAAADTDADDDYDDDRKSDPYMSPSYAGDTKNVYLLQIYPVNIIFIVKRWLLVTF